MSGRFLRLATGLMLALCLAGPLAACGKKGAPSAPADEPNVYPRAYPSTPGVTTPAPDRSAFPTLQPDTNINPITDPTRPRSPE